MSRVPAEGRLHVVGLGPRPAAWDRLVAVVAALCGVPPVVEAWRGPGEPSTTDPMLGRPAGTTDRMPGRAAGTTDSLLARAAGTTDSLLARAAGTTDPVLVLPASGPASPAGGAGVRRVLVPIDRSFAQRRVVRHWIRRAQSAGLEVVELHVLGATNRPRMWEGSGHHAEAWRTELRRRHQVDGADLVVRSGDPAAALVAASGRADLVVVHWNGDASAGRAPVVRALLERNERPLLLVQRVPGGAASSGPRDVSRLGSAGR